MLFDLRARGRRRTVQMVYLGLAVLMGGGLILFGIGGATSGGLLDAFKGGSGGSSGGNVYEARVKQAQAAVRARPHNADAWAQLARYQYLFATSGNGYSSQTGSFSPSARPDLAKATVAWERYLSLNPRSPDPNVATLMVRAYSAPGGLNQLSKAVEAEQLVAQARPSFGVYTQLAELGYAAGQIRTGDLAADKAVSLAPQAQRKFLRARLAQIKAQAQQQSARGAATGGATGAAAGPSGR